MPDTMLAALITLALATPGSCLGKIQYPRAWNISSAHLAYTFPNSTTPSIISFTP